MKFSEIQAVVCDLDGTLLYESKISKKDIDTFSKLGKNNICRIIATGRSLFSFNNIDNNNLPIDFLIFSCGSGILDFKTGKIIKNNFLNKEEVSQITQKLTELKFDFQVRLPVPEGHKYLYRKFGKSNPDFERLQKKYKNYSSEFKQAEKASRIIIISENQEIIKPVFDNFREYNVIRATSPIDNKSVWMEIYPKGINKGTAVEYLFDKSEIQRNKTIGLGNDYNDIDFLNITEKSYITDNAPEILKKKYHTTVTNRNNPLTEIIKLF